MTSSFGLDVVSSCNGWHDLYRSATPCSANACSFSTTASSVAAATAWTTVGRLSPVQHNHVAATTVTVSPSSAAWRLQSSNNANHCQSTTAVFSAPTTLFMRAPCAAENQSAAYSFQNVANQQPGGQVSVIGKPFSSVFTGNTETPGVGGSFSNVNLPSQPAVSSLNAVLQSSSTADSSLPPVCSSKCLSTFASTSVRAVSDCGSDGHNTSHACQKHVVHSSCVNTTSPTSHQHCANGISDHHHLSRLEDDDDYDEDEDESGSDDSSATSNQKDGKYCECWHCEFFGHSNVSCFSAFMIAVFV